MKKRLFSAILSLLLVFSLCACGSDSPQSGNIEGTLEEILGKVVKDAADPEMALLETPVTEENFSWFFFIDPIEGAEGLVSEAAIGSIPHCIGLLRVPASADAEQVKNDIEANLNPAKWVCVEAEKTAVVRHGDLILVALAETTAVDKAVEQFDALAK